MSKEPTETVSGLPFIQNIIIILNCLDAEK